MQRINSINEPQSTPKAKLSLTNFSFTKRLIKDVRGMMTAMGIFAGAAGSSSCMLESEDQIAQTANLRSEASSIKTQNSSEKLDYSQRFSAISTDGKKNWYVQISYTKPFIVEAYVDGNLAYVSDVLQGEEEISAPYQAGQKELRIKPFEVDEKGDVVREIPIVHDHKEATTQNILGYNYGKLR